MLMISLLPLLSLSCIIYLASPLFGNDFAYEGKNLKELADVLEENVLGQEEPIASLLNILNRYFSKVQKIKTQQGFSFLFSFYS